MKQRPIALLCLAAVALTACGTGSTGTASTEAGEPTDPTITIESVPDSTTTTEPEPIVLTLMAHNSFAGAVTNDTFGTFTAETGVEVVVLAAGDAGTMLSQAILTKANPIADVLFGIDDAFLSRALDENLFLAFESVRIGDLAASLRLDPLNRVTPIDFGDVCVNYDRAIFAGEVPPPLNLEQLILPEFADRLVVQNPATSSPGLAFLLATIAVFGEDGWQEYWADLVDNGVKVVSDWDTAYYAEFTRYGGDRPMVVSYASSPPAEVIFSDQPIDIAPTGVVDEGCYRQIEFAGILAGTRHEEAAGLLIDYMTSIPFQESIPETWFVFPANEKAQLPDVFEEHAVIPAAPFTLDPEDIEENRERWIKEWTEIVLP